MKTIYITEEQKNILKEHYLLLEARGDRELKRYIREYTNKKEWGVIDRRNYKHVLATFPYIEDERESRDHGESVAKEYARSHNGVAGLLGGYIGQYLEYPLSDLPTEMVQICNPGEGESELFSSVKNNQDGSNRFIDFLRLNFFSDFSITRNGPTKEYLEGLARIALGELGYYSFDYRMKGDKAIKLAKYVKVFSKHPEIAQRLGVELDGNLNGFNYDQVIEAIQPVYDEYVTETKTTLRARVYDTQAGYRIVEIKDRPISTNGTPSMSLTPESYNYLAGLSPYADWCILGNRHPGMYEQYTCGGGKFYVCEKDGFRDIPREPGENCPVDEYGLSLIAVLVAPDGLPERITTRWNHDYGGEDHEQLENAIQLQDLLKVKYLDIFKPRTENELRSLHLAEGKVPTAQDQVDNKVNAGVMDAVTCGGTMEEGAEPESNIYEIGAEKNAPAGGTYYHVMNEEQQKENNEFFKKYFKEIADFMDKSGLKVKPLPKLKLDWSDQDGLFIRTGYYEPDEKSVTVFCKNRHPKDVLRSFAHEMIHHHQNLRGESFDFGNDDVKDNKRLEKIESEAYLKGNIFFRKWTEYVKESKKPLNESVILESSYDEYYHFTEMDGLMSILDSGEFRLAGSDKNSSTSNYASQENNFRGGIGGYISLTRMRSVEQGYQSSMIKSKDSIARITFDGIALNNLRGVSIKPLDFIYNWNKNMSSNLYQDYSPRAVLTGTQDKDFSYGKSGRALYTNGGYNKDLLKKGGKRANDEIQRQVQNQAEESLVFNNSNGIIPKNELLRVIKRIDVLILNPSNNFTPEYIIKRYRLDENEFSDRIFVYKQSAKGYFNLGKNIGCVNAAANTEMNYYENAANYMMESEIFEDTDPENIDLSSFKIQKELNPKFWKNELLDSRIRLKLLDIAEDFIDFLGVDWVKPKDIIMTGSLANFNWNKNFSDIDLHILIDFSKVDKRKDFVKKYFDSQKNLWNEEHGDLKIFGFPVELYVQDVNDVHTSTGVYSIEKNMWVKEPKREKLAKSKVNKSLIKNKVAGYIDKIDNLEKEYKESKGDEYKTRKISEKVDKLISQIRDERKNELNNKDKKGNEISNGNIIYKCLRRLNYIDKIYDLKTKTYDNLNSLP